MSATSPAISVVISTRNRGDSVLIALRSLLQCNHESFEVVVVDQSDNDETADAAHELAHDSHLRYLRSPRRGLSCGRNDGIRASRGDLIAITDDDCEPAPDWLRQVEAAFNLDPRIGVVFGTTRAGGHDPQAGMIPSCIIRQTRIIRSTGNGISGMGACMALRRRTWERLNGFDESLGAGARFSAGEELDFALRSLIAGEHVCEAPGPEVVHHGFRAEEASRELLHSYWFGTGAVVAKLMKCGHPSILQFLARIGWNWLAGGSEVARSFGPHTSRWSRLTAFARGALDGAATPVDRTRVQFAPPEL